ncbi:MAG: imidazoleglycerol-phosphate dehydratase HisB [Myxococcales bacterium]|nr:imidazoleglycerol-phosphate dehydratase HisB [Myxococcales bacterium]
MARRAELSRETTETKVAVGLELDGQGACTVQTPLPFLTHMIEQLGKHALFDLQVEASGDTHIDGHHVTEDLGIVLGQTLAAALGDKRGISRYGWATLPMDEARVTVALDLSGRTFFQWDVPMPKAKLGEWDTELAEVFFEGFARGAQCNLHVSLHAGNNLHHITEVSFKALARALRLAIAIEPRAVGVPSTKGTLSG